MKKEYLEALEEIIDKFADQIMRANKEELTAINKTNAIEYLYRTPQVRLLQQALFELKAIKEAKPSEALKDLKELHELAYDIDVWKIEDIVQSLHIKQALLKSQEQEKVLEIILKKNVEILDVRIYCDYGQYCRVCANTGLRKDWWLTKEEFDFLKEYVENETDFTSAWKSSHPFIELLKKI